jgi:hypothetical protein
MMRLHNQSCRFSLSGKPAGLEEKHNVWRGKHKKRSEVRGERGKERDPGRKGFRGDGKRNTWWKKRKTSGWERGSRQFLRGVLPSVRWCCPQGL